MSNRFGLKEAGRIASGFEVDFGTEQATNMRARNRLNLDEIACRICGR